MFDPFSAFEKASVLTNRLALPHFVAHSCNASTLSRLVKTDSDTDSTTPSLWRVASAMFGELSCREDLPLPQSELPIFSLNGNCSRIIRIEEECPQRPAEFASAEEGRLLVWSQ